MIILLLIVIIATLLLGATYVRSCLVQIGALFLAAVTFIELKKQLAWIPDSAWWIGGFVVLFAVVCYIARQNHLQDEKAKAKAARIQRGREERAAEQSIEEA